MAVQTSISAAPAIGLKGQMATTEGAEFTSKLALEAIVPGDVVIHAGDNTCELPDVTGEVTAGTAAGIAVLDPYRTSADYADGEAVRICTKGEILVDVTVAGSTVGGPVYVIFTTGKIRGTSDAGAVALPNAVFLTAGTGVQRVKLTGPFKA
jgi:hypothetical protein